MEIQAWVFMHVWVRDWGIHMCQPWMINISEILTGSSYIFKYSSVMSQKIVYFCAIAESEVKFYSRKQNKVLFHKVLFQKADEGFIS